MCRCKRNPEWKVRFRVNLLAECNRLGYTQSVIQSFRNKGLEKFFMEGTTSGVQPSHESRLRLILGRLEAANSPIDMNLPGLRLHQLKGARKGIWSVSVSGNWRVTFAFEGIDAVNVNYEDYH